MENISDLLILAGGVILLLLGIKTKWDQRNAQRDRDILFKRETEEIEKVTKEIAEAKVDYEKKKLVVMEVIDGARSDDDGDKPGEG